MNSLSRKRAPSALLLPSLALLLTALLFNAASAAPPPVQREHLTPQEVEFVRENQELDKRVGVFVKAAERRFIAVTDPPAAARQTAKDTEQWGEIKGTRTQLLFDLARILDEAITNIDDTATRSPSSPLLKKSLNQLAEASRRFLPPLAALREASQDETERDALERAIERTQEIMEAAKKHPVEDDAEGQKGKKKKSGV
jgi:hypothetical protein